MGVSLRKNLRFVNISSEMFLNFFSMSPRKSSIASASFADASDGDPPVVVTAVCDWVDMFRV